jgi:hypothetical protein
MHISPKRKETMTRAWRTKTSCLVLLFSALQVGPLASAPLPPHLEKAISGLTSDDISERSRSFYSLVFSSKGENHSISTHVKALLRAYPAEAERIKLALIAALEREGAYRLQVEASQRNLTEGFTNYFGDLIWAVGELRDGRAVKGLLAGVDTGGLAVNALADICPAALDAIIAKSREPDRPFQGARIHGRDGAVSTLGECLNRQEAVRAHPEMVAKIRKALIEALDDPHWVVRAQAASALFHLRDDPEVAFRLKQVAESDPYITPSDIDRGRQSPFPVRSAAAGALAADPNQFYYVMVVPETRACRVQQANETPLGQRYIGPISGRQAALQQMCRHYDDLAQDPSLCWFVSPPNACRQR